MTEGKVPRSPIATKGGEAQTAITSSNSHDNDLVINVTPIAGTLTGGAAIISYELQMDNGSGFVSILGGVPSTYTLST